ncbi:endonuclease/exonuclease/phosphatase family protein [Bifidobacterium sp. SO1]|uniref:endonuclease/exonuclease/phosphatase family protein n=1 Tax=Bifidobacterium sp. SO1 TaxID=2809029 RepID=UPI001BDDC3EC|nr:endonuclease/exonuclease/phosphatase family protein [Bifidobacterium sp. SO1]MBT1162610.1 endonuclease/exonuclease/phosphatase family protein [Bifidobacterium sp. SO1]
MTEPTNGAGWQNRPQYEPSDPEYDAVYGHHFDWQRKEDGGDAQDGETRAMPAVPAPPAPSAAPAAAMPEVYETQPIAQPLQQPGAAGLRGSAVASQSEVTPTQYVPPVPPAPAQPSSVAPGSASFESTPTQYVPPVQIQSVRPAQQPVPPIPQYEQPAVQPQRQLGAAAINNGSDIMNNNAYASSPQSQERTRSKRGNWFTKPGKHGFLSFFLWVAMLPCIGIMVLRETNKVDQDGRALPEILAFVPIFGIIAAVVLVLAVLWRRKLLTLVALACVAVQVMWHIGYFMPAVKISETAKQTVASAAATDDNVARIMTLNTREGKASAQQIVAAVRTQHVEVLALEEVSDSLLTALQEAGLYDVLPYYVTSVATAGDNGGINGLWTMAPMSNISESLLPTEASQMPAGSVQIGKATVRFVAAHPSSPTRGNQGVWSSGLSTISDLKNYDWSYVIMGDFNSTWDHPRFRSLLGDSFVDAGEQAGEGFHFTYPANSKIPSLIEIDHIVYAKNRGVKIGQLATETIAGSDHKALLATLETE